MVPPDDHRQPVVGQPHAVQPRPGTCRFRGHASDNPPPLPAPAWAAIGTPECRAPESGSEPHPFARPRASASGDRSVCPRMRNTASCPASPSQVVTPHGSFRFGSVTLTGNGTDCPGPVSSSGRGCRSRNSTNLERRVLSRYALDTRQRPVFHKVHENTLRNASHLELVRGRVRHHRPAEQDGGQPTQPHCQSAISHGPVLLRMLVIPYGGSDDTSTPPKGANARRGILYSRAKWHCCGCVVTGHLLREFQDVWRDSQESRCWQSWVYVLRSLACSARGHMNSNLTPRPIVIVNVAPIIQRNSLSSPFMS